jgi:hypothetical protein
MEMNEVKMTVWLVAPGAHYEGETVAFARLFHAEAEARAYEADLMAADGLLGVDYVVVRELEVA